MHSGDGVKSFTRVLSLEKNQNPFSTGLACQLSSSAVVLCLFRTPVNTAKDRLVQQIALHHSSGPLSRFKLVLRFFWGRLDWTDELACRV